MAAVEDFRTCAICRRVVFTNHVDAQGRCCYCEDRDPPVQDASADPVSTAPGSRSTPGPAPSGSTPGRTRVGQDVERDASSRPDVSPVSHDGTQGDE